MFYEKLAEKKQERKSQQRSRLDDVGFNVGAGMLAHKGLEKALDASAFSPYNQTGRDLVALGRSAIFTDPQIDYVPREAVEKIYKEYNEGVAKKKDEVIEGSITTTHNPLTRIVDKISGAQGMAAERRRKLNEAEKLYQEHLARPDVAEILFDDGGLRDEAEELTKKMRKRRLLGRRVAHGVGLGATLLGANKLRNMYNNRNQEKKTAAFVKMLSED